MPSVGNAMVIVVNRMRDRIGSALVGAAIGYVVSCCLPPFGWALVAPVFSLLMATHVEIVLIILAAMLGAAFATAGLARLCPFPVKRWLVVCVAAVLTAGTIWTYLRWLLEGLPDSGPLG